MVDAWLDPCRRSPTPVRTRCWVRRHHRRSARRGRWRGAGVHDHRAETDRSRRAHQADLAGRVPQAAGPRRGRRHRRRDRRPVHRRLAGRHHPRPPRHRASIRPARRRGRRPLPASSALLWPRAGSTSPKPTSSSPPSRTCPPTSTPSCGSRARQHLVEQAAQFGPRELRRLGDRLLEAIAPDIADQAEYERLVAEERRAHAATKLTFRPRGDGSTDLFARIPDHVANRLRTYLDSFTSPRRMALDRLGEVDQLPVARRRGEAFCALLENLPDTGLPHHGGTATT